MFNKEGHNKYFAFHIKKLNLCDFYQFSNIKFLRKSKKSKQGAIINSERGFFWASLNPAAHICDCKSFVKNE